MWTHGHFYWNELMTRDAAAATKFYEDSLGWAFTQMPMPDGGTYHLVVDAGEKPVAGIMQMAGPDFEGVPEHWFSYISVDDVDARIKKAVNNGATVMREPFDVEGIGRICILQQPNGAMIGWMTPAGSPEG